MPLLSTNINNRNSLCGVTITGYPFTVAFSVNTNEPYGSNNEFNLSNIAILHSYIFFIISQSPY